MSVWKKIKEFLEIKEVEVGKPPAKTEAKPVSEDGKPETSAIEVEQPEPIEQPEIGEEGKRKRIKTLEERGLR